MGKADVNDQDKLSTQDWIDVAKRLLISEGIESVKIDRIARECGVTRGGFYWRFNNRAELLNHLLVEWRESNTKPLLDALANGGSVAERFKAGADLWIDEERFDPQFDTAVRNWAVVAADARKVVAEVDELRVGAFRALFIEAGFSEDEALVRARITYYHQIGYYTLGVHEDHAERQRLSRYYYKVLTGLPAFS